MKTACLNGSSGRIDFFIRFVLTAVLFFRFMHLGYAQCERYRHEIFSAVMIATAFYDDARALRVDIYQPEGDTTFKRPLLIFAHGGQFTTGDRASDPVAVDFCTHFAKCGYVTASIDYRLSTFADLIDTQNALIAINNAVNDFKSVIRYLRRDASTTNTFGIDSAQIYIGGNEAGAVLANHCAFVDNILEIPPHYAEIINTHGGIEGDGTYFGWSAESRGVINWCGGVNSTDWMSSDDEDLFSAHGDTDQAVDFYCNEVFHSTVGSFANTLWMCGSGSMHVQAASTGQSSYLLTFHGEDSQPWLSDADIMDTVVEHTAEWLFARIDCGLGTAYSNINAMSKVEVQPNPVHDYVLVTTDEPIVQLEVFGADGKHIMRSTSGEQQLCFSNLQNGIYLLRIVTSRGVCYKRLCKI